MDEGFKVAAYVVRRRHRERGRSVASAFYTLRYRLPGESRYRQRPLGVRDKVVAEQLCRKFVLEQERELAGVSVPRVLRDAASRDLTLHVEDYADDLDSLGRDSMYVYTLRKRLCRLISECGWRVLSDVTADSFQSWRCRQSLKARTLNQYVASLHGFLNWMRRRGRLIANPLAGVVVGASVVADDVGRRALSDDEVSRLLSVAGDRRAVYLVALLTGLRRSELSALRWSDVHLDAVRPYLRARASTTKNGKAAVMWLRDDAAAALRAVRPAACPDDEPVFVGGVPGMEAFRVDLAAAGIPEKDASGSVVVFHSLRHTLATNLARSGVAPRVAMELMRHSDMRLTMRTYTDAGQLPTSDALDRLPRFEVQAAAAVMTGTDDSPAASHDASHETSQLGVRSGPRLSASVMAGAPAKGQNRSVNSGESPPLAASVTASRKSAKSWGTRIRT